MSVSILIKCSCLMAGHGLNGRVCRLGCRYTRFILNCLFIVKAHDGIALDNLRALICGGYSFVNSSCNPISQCYIYSARHDVWVTAQPMERERWDHSMVMFDGDSLIYLK